MKRLEFTLSPLSDIHSGCSWPRRPEAFPSLPVFIYPAKYAGHGRKSANSTEISKETLSDTKYYVTSLSE